VAEPALRLSLDVSAVPSRPAGAGHYIVELARALSARADVEPVLFARRSDRARWQGLAEGLRVSASAPDARPLRLAWEQVRFARLLDRAGIDVHHSPHDTMPERARVPVVVTVHDLSFFESPGWHERTKVVVFKRAIAVAARRAAVVVCPSRFTADELARWCRVEAEVVVAPHGVDTTRFSPEEPAPGADAALLSRVDARLVDGRPSVVFVGTLEPRKDVVGLVDAFSRVAGRHPDTRLVLAGGRGWGADAVDAAVVASGLGERVVRTGYVTDGVVPALLRTASAVAYPARYEGFGLPALEALACGAPLVTTAGTAMEEVAGDAALLVPPGDVAGLADALDALLEGLADAADRRRRGLEVAARHTWAESAARHVEAYRIAARSGVRRSGRSDGSPGAQPVG
jgi:glycosyltransferase involved in cell wall biosynthesis